MEISATDLAALVAAEIAKHRASAEAPPVAPPLPAPPPVPHTSIAASVCNPDEVTIRFHRFTTLTYGGQLTAYQSGQEAGFPSRVARQIIAAGSGFRVGHELG